MTPIQYEMAVLERFRVAWPLPSFEVRHNVRLLGKKTRASRQVDVAIYAAGDPQPIMLVEVKRHNRPIDAGIAGSTIAMMQDIGGTCSVMVSTSGFSVAAANHLEAEEIDHLTITLTEAMALRWIPDIRARFEVDGEFAEISGELVESIRQSDASLFMDVDIPYEEWCAVVEVGLATFPQETKQILTQVALNHYEADVRYNAIQFIADNGGIDSALIARLVATENDADVVQLLIECTAQ